MKKIMIALLIVASIFVLASCAPAVVTQALTLKSVDGQVASGSVSVTMDANAKAYYMVDGGYLALPASEKGDYGTLTYAKTQIDGSSQDTYAFAYKGDVGATGSETQGVKVYIGVLNSDAKSFKTKYAEVTINASAEWSGSTPVAVALNTNVTKASKTLAAAGEKIYVDGVENIEAVNVKDASGNNIGLFEVDLSADKKTVNFEFRDLLGSYDASVSGKALKVEVKNGTVLIATYNVTCSHIGTTPTYVVVDLNAETQADDEVYADYSVNTDKETLSIWQVNKKGELVETGYYVSTDPDYEDDVLVDGIENDNIIDGWTIGKFKMEGVGRAGKALTGVKFTLDTTFNSADKNGALGGGASSYKFVLKDLTGKEVEYFDVSAVVSPMLKGINSVLKTTSLAGIDTASTVADVWCYDDVSGVWTKIDTAFPLFDESTDYYVGKIWFESASNSIKFSTEDYTVGSKTYKASYGKGRAAIGLNKVDDKDYFEGGFYLYYENVEVSPEVSTVIKVTDAKGSKGIFNIGGSKTDVLYGRYITDYSKGKYTWSDWFVCFGDNQPAAADKYDFKYWNKSLKSAGELLSVSYLRAGGFKCIFSANTSEEDKTFGETGYYEFAVVNEIGNVVATYLVEGTNGYSSSTN